MILFIDDELRRVKLYIEELNSLGYQVELKDSFDEALEFWESNQTTIDLVVLDVMMPLGENFNETQEEEAEYGKGTGIYFYQNYLQSANIPIVIFTHRAGLKEDEISNPQHFLLKKIDYLPYQFAKKVALILNNSKKGDR